MCADDSSSIFHGDVFDLTAYEIRLFDSDANANNANNEEDADEQQRQVIETVSQMRGLKERLMDASMTAKLEGNGDLRHFLQRSDAIVQELSSAISQKMSTSSRNGSVVVGKRKRSDLHCNLPLGYFDALHKQCLQVDELLKSLQAQASSSTCNCSVGENSLDGITLNDELTKVTIYHYDKSNRCHDLVGELQPTFPSVGPDWICDLPVEFEPKWKRNSNHHHSDHMSGLAGVVKEFIEMVSTYQSLWDEMDDIDANAWVLEPSLPSRRSCSERRVALRTGLSIHFSLDPDNPRSVPLTMRFIGASKDMNDLRSAYQKYISSDDQDQQGGDKGWSEDLSVRCNQEAWFGFPLPSPATTDKAAYIVECGVCYSHRISANDNDEEDTATVIPNITCSNTSCARSYHESCLSEWLHSLPGAKTSFGRIFGQCPYCCDSISVKVAGNY